MAETINIWSNLRRHLLLPAAPIQLKFLCSALAKTILAFVVIICGPLWLTYSLPQVFDVLKHISVEKYRQYIGSGSRYIFVKYIGNISGLAALARHSLDRWIFKGVQHYTRRSRSDKSHWVTYWVTESALALTLLMWPWWVMIPIEDFTDVILITLMTLMKAI